MFKKVDGFIICLLFVLIISSVIPRCFVDNLHKSIGTFCNVGISLIFFFYGLKMNRQDVAKGLRNYKLHIVVQLSTFVFFPILAYLARPIFYSIGIGDFWIAFLFLAALPSTVSSSVVMVSMAKGNVPAAIFNASLSGLIGVLLTPLLMSVESGFSDLLSTIYNLVLSILLPVFVGLFLNKYYGNFANTHKKKLAIFDKSIILLIVFNSFSEAFSSGLFSNFTLLNIVFIALFVIILLFAVYYVVLILSVALGFSTEDKITACFCGSKKSLMHGSVMVQAMFKTANAQALMLLPIMIYHSVQLIVISFVAQQYARRKD